MPEQVISIEKDLEWLAAIKRGESVAFDKVFQSYHRYLFSIAYRYLSDEHRAKDTVQEVFLDLWRRRDVIDVQHSLKFFLRRAVINICLAAKRKNSRVSFGESLDINHPTTDQEGIHGATELQDILSQTLALLPPKCREVFQLSRDEGKSHKEIAQQLDISTKTVEHHISRALKTIREEFKKYGLMGWVLFYLLIH